VDALRNYFNAADETALRGFTGRLGHLYFANYILAQIDATSGSRILDIGCGDGAVLAAVKELRPDLDCVGIDFADKQIAKAISSPQIDGLEFKVNNVLDGPLSSGTFDRIYSFSVVQYFTPLNFQMVCSYLRTSLRHDGMLIHMSIPDISKRVLLFQQSFLDQHSVSSWKNWIHLGKMVLVDMKRRVLGQTAYGTDSHFHNAETLAATCSDAFTAKIIRPSDSWYRFDIQLRPRSPHAGH
jgi:2-polyprenyl-3-methyl-5-hydroxy-6-metoxy-1,4-benzoquinol methylase